jgi:FkbM family methyltransferase
MMNWWSVFERQDYKPVCDLFPDKQAELTIVDVGAYVGYSAMYFAQQFENSKIDCFEGDEENFQFLTKNIRQTRNNIIAFNVPVWDKEAWLLQKKDYRDKKEWSYYWEESVCGTVKPIKMTTVCDRPVDILKIDVEGGEFAIFRDPSFLDKCKVVCMEIHHEKGNPHDIFEAFKRHNFHVQQAGEIIIATRGVECPTK